MAKKTFYFITFRWLEVDLQKSLIKCLQIGLLTRDCNKVKYFFSRIKPAVKAVVHNTDFFHPHQRILFLTQKTDVKFSKIRSGTFIPDLGSWLWILIHLGSRIRIRNTGFPKPVVRKNIS